MVNNVLFFLLGAVGLVDVDDETVTWATTLLSSAMTVIATIWVLKNLRVRAKINEAPMAEDRINGGSEQSAPNLR